MKKSLSFACVAVVAGVCATVSMGRPDEKAPTTAPSAASATEHKESAVKSDVPSVLQFKVKSLAGKVVDLAQYKGKVVLFVNSASKCGYTKQYAQLQTLNEKYKSKGLEVLGFPSGDFKEQEFQTSEETAAFCKANFGVTFDLFEKSHVKGEEQVPLFKFLTSEATSPFPGEIKWNFEKFLVGRDGKIIARYRSAIEPTSDEVVHAIETSLAK